MVNRYAVLSLAGFFFLSPINTNAPTAKTTLVAIVVDSSHDEEEITENDSLKVLSDLIEQAEQDEYDDFDEYDDEDDEEFEEISTAFTHPVKQEEIEIEIEVAVEVEMPKKRMMSVLIDIPFESQRYRHWTGFSYKPEEFYCTVNGVKALPAEEVTVVMPDDSKLVVEYYSRFENGRESAKRYTYRVDPDRAAVTVRFDWKRKERIYVDDATAVFEVMEEII
jgi:hypothetical protein